MDVVILVYIIHKILFQYSTSSDSDSPSDGDLPLPATSKMALNQTLSISATRHEELFSQHYPGKLDGGSNVNLDIFDGLREKLKVLFVFFSIKFTLPYYVLNCRALNLLGNSI